MGNTNRGEILDSLHVLFDTGTAVGLTDGQLLERFASRRDASSDLAFAALVERHGPVVLNVCEGVLRDRHDAEDAFQATFLVLARRAASIRKRDSVASWLYGVALRVASGARSSAARRRSHEKKVVRSPGSLAPDEFRTDDGLLLHEEVSRLPERYREPVLLCFFEGLTHEEAAQQLGWPLGTVKSRLARGKERLRARLHRQGLDPSPGLHAVSISLAKATARLAPSCLAGHPATVGAVPASVSVLMKGALRAMMLNQWKTVAMYGVLSLAVLGVGVGVYASGKQGDDSASTPAGEKTSAAVRVKSEVLVETRSDDPATVTRLERRLESLERRLDAVLSPRQDAVDLIPQGREPESDTVRKIRPRFECLVEKVHVKSGQTVKKGEPLVELFSTQLAAAKNDYLSSTVLIKHDQLLYDLREKLVKTGSISQQLWFETQTSREKSQLEATVARDHLFFLGLGQQEIDVIQEEKGDQKARFTLRSPVDGKVTRIEVGPQDLSDPKSVLMRISTGKP